jgi:hypothetical protein
MAALWQWWVRIGFSEDFAMMVQREPLHLALTSLNDVLAKSKATLMRQFVAFADYMTGGGRKRHSVDAVALAFL